MSIIRQPFFSSSRKAPSSCLVGPPQGVRLGQDVGQPLQSLEQRRVAEREVELGRVEDVEDDDLVAAVAEVLEPGEDPGRTSSKRSEKIADHPALLEPLGQVVEDHAQVRLLPRGGDVEQVDQLLQVRRLAGRLEVAPDRVVEERQADRILLLEDHVGERRDDELRVLELR